MKPFRRVIAATIVAGLMVPGIALAQQTATPPAAPAPAPVAPVPEPEPPAAQLAAARDVVVASGMARSFGPMIPQLRDQIAPMLTRTRPELSKDLGDVIKQLTPEFDKKTDDMINIAARIYARRMSEEELKQTAAFFNSPVGKKYVEVQPIMLDELVVAMQSWTQEISNYMLQRVRDEMAKKGHQFL